MTRPLLSTFLVVLLLLTGVSLWLTRGDVTSPEALSTLETSAGEAAIGGQFSLTDQNGKAVTDATYRGKPMLVFFGFTHCPDICPGTMAVYKEVLEILGPDAGKFTPIMITVDPARDTPAVLKDYAAKFDARIQGLTGSQEQIEAAASAYKAYYSVSNSGHGAHADHSGHGAPQGQDYMVNHSGYIYLMDAKGSYVKHFAWQDGAAPIATALKATLQ